MKEQPSLHQLYLDVSARKARKERNAKLACTVLLMLGTIVWCYALVTPQP